MEEIQLYLEDAREQMTKVLQHAGHELTKIRAGKANPSMLDGIQVSYYGAQSPLNQISSITSPDPRTLFIKPWEKSSIPEIEKAIMAANLGLTPQNDGNQVIINIPMLTEERRKQLVKQVHQECEHGKVSIRSVRKETNENLKQIKGAPEDDLKNAEKSVQDITDEFIGKIDALMKKKEAEILTV
ncbi:MAG: ribosome recycling factor [Cytophagales bacterium]|nr:ribosome recycling factor [Cytophagales bacterium]